MNTIRRYHRTLLAILAVCFAGVGWWGVEKRGRVGVLPVRAAEQKPVDVLTAIPVANESGATDLAIVKWTKQAREKGDARVWVNLGDALMQKARETGDPAYYGHAKGVYEKAATFNAQNDDALTGLAWAYGGMHQFDQSREWASKAIALNERNHLAYGLLGDANVEQGDYDAAFTHYQKMLDLRPDISSYSRGAHLLHITGQTNRAA